MATTTVPLHMQYYQQHVLGPPKPAPRPAAAAAAPTAVQTKTPPPQPVPYVAPGDEQSLVGQYLRTKVAPAKKPPPPKIDDMHRFYAPISDPKEISKYASHYVAQPRAKVPLTVQYYLDHVMKVPPPKPQPAATSAYKDPSMSLVEQYKMRQGMSLQKPTVPAAALLPGSYGLTLEGSYALHSLQKAASLAASSSGPSAAVQSMDAFTARLKSTEPIATLGEAQRLIAHLARCLNEVVAPPPKGKWPEEQRSTMRYYFTAVLEELEAALMVTPLRRARERNQQVEVNAMLVQEIPEHARQYGLDVIARLKVAHKYPAGAGSWPAAQAPVTTMPATGPPTCPRSPAACVMPRTATLDARLKDMQVPLPRLFDWWLCPGVIELLRMSCPADQTRGHAHTRECVCTNTKCSLRVCRRRWVV
jgi:hypothetical protein